MNEANVGPKFAVESAITSNLTLVGKLLGQLVTHHDVRHTSILASHDYLALRSALVAALRPYPEAMRAVGEALHRLESDAARDITATSKATTPPVLIENEPAPRVTPPPC